jgi:hypothetical protein
LKALEKKAAAKAKKADIVAETQVQDIPLEPGSLGGAGALSLVTTLHQSSSNAPGFSIPQINSCIPLVSEYQVSSDGALIS